MRKELLTVAELLQVAVDDERTGAGFYEKVADDADDAGLAKVFTDLAAEERGHLARFERMLADVADYLPRQEHPGEYTAYLRTLTDHRFFPDERTATHLARNCGSDAERVDLANRFERDTLMLMNEIRGMVPEDAQEVLDEVTEEERAHLVTLAEARRMLGS